MILDNFAKNFVDKLIRQIAPRGNINPIGKCFDAVGHQVMLEPRPRMMICHGLVVENCGPNIGKTIAHAWIEIDGLAYDCIWGFKCSVAQYRQDAKASNVIRYTRDEFMRLWHETDFPGPWDKTIFAHTSDGQRIKNETK